MDVDLLRPGTVPISPDTILWFEFLLDRNLLLKHLEKSSADPTPTELITKFTTAIYESMKNETKRVEVENGEPIIDISEATVKHSLKNIALKILSLKVAAYIKWNPVALRALPFKVQISLLQDLMFFTNNDTWVEIPNIPDYTETISETLKPHLFALVIYHRWFIGTCMFRILNNIHNRNNGDITPMEENMICTQENIDKSLAFLNDVLTWDSIPQMITFDCFVTLTEASRETQLDWDHALNISKEEFRSQIHYDLAAFYFYNEHYELATLHFVNCTQLYRQIDKNVGFNSVDLDCLESYLLACNNQRQDSKPTLLQQLSTSVVNQYMGVLNILIQDNKFREIPLTHRINLELDIQGALSSGKFTVARDLLPKIQALNAIRCILNRNTSHQYNFATTKSQDFLIWATSAVWKAATQIDKFLLCTYYMQLIVNTESVELLDKLENHDILHDIFDHIDSEKLRFTIVKDVEVSDMLTNSNWDFPEAKRNPKLEIRLLEQQIISCYGYKELRELLVKLTIKNPSRPIWKINPIWELPIPLQSVVTAIPRGFMQDFSYVLLAKSRELMLSKDWGSSIDFLKALENEVQANNSLPKLAKLISWEILLVQITQLFEEWPAPNIDRQALSQACENCLKSTESVIPRTEIMEQCVLCLLNLGRWEFLSSFEKRWSYFEVAAAITTACQDILKHKGSKKLSKDLWELVIPIFAMSSSQSKRSSSGNTNVMHRDSPINNTKIQLMAFFNRLREPTALAIVISMLSKLYNILKDESSLDVNIEYVMLWPSAISNINSYNTVAVTEALSDLVHQALKFYPINVAWLKLMGDINFSNSNYENSIKYYLQSLIVSSDYFNLQVRADDHIFKRMIKSCTQLGCHTQAAVLCQFLEDPDYTLAFRSLVDFKCCNDSVEAYYHCFWDTNIVEYLVHLHHKRGEFQRRKKAVHTIGLLELNSNNNEEIQREAINLRKRTFLQAMCQQYIC